MFYEQCGRLVIVYVSTIKSAHELHANVQVNLRVRELIESQCAACIFQVSGLLRVRELIEPQCSASFRFLVYWIAC